MNTQTKVKVDRLQLIDALKKRKVVIEEHGKRERASHSDRVKKAGVEAARTLRKMADDLERGKWPRRSYMDLPSKPVIGGADTVSLERAIHMLELSRDEAVTITAEDYGKYL